MPRKRHVSRNILKQNHLRRRIVMPRKRHVSRNNHDKFNGELEEPVMPRKRHVSRNREVLFIL